MGNLRAVGMAGSLAVAIALAGCGPASEQSSTVEVARPVEVLAVTSEPLALVSELPGRVEPVRVAQVRARVAGIVLHKRFVEGADVKAGDLLFQIDPAPFKAAVARAEGELARAQSGMLEAQARVKRYAPLVKIEAVSQQDYDSATAELRRTQAATRSAEADLQTARLNLGYASVTAPISGRVGRALVTEGALVGQGDATLMVRIQQLDPVYVDFTQPAADALRLREALKNGTLAADAQQGLSVRIEGTSYERQGSLLFTDVAVDPGTGQVALRGQFDNRDGNLLPGMYVRVRTPQGTDSQAILVPQRAVLRSPDGSASVLVMDGEGRAQQRPVQTGAMQGARWQIRDGLKVGDRVIVSGLAGLQPGAKVEPKSALATASGSQQ
ncbi:MexC family multidrug efflux RND transporter periplasmic adaptor subunit [Pseudomonas chlororaphis]|jgi:membrane fusion protein, multidrug efflux system|uniref:MexC family multidrug efflux RND transporter periplasmic adaptor subunit n=1 Tax=Pseudomonas chlororaphis TaxID=587753 RepID=UPI000E0A7FFD|nr:MexC family multidrug efflux RND transporter periplasmic adaptor subunit [Pseudomonas chlororaphis]AZD15931.1 Multidrug efflux system, membrane fusion component MexC [Pseudomonas chlororaphis]WDH44611.1 MexC family multidrug efflux RND transporter periplasmic adaptor subunit [Pseudomonas chlororaphis]WDH56458.1 MexC family multidrug efflux RND transporter periplasmic adaptor subunit [Pseudomonas chlororaphis]WQE21417.1 MexC family multidrug efflux RND transporter periplasmic adaptor subunit 